MPATVLVVVIPEVPPVIGADEILMRIAANRQTGGQHALIADQDIVMSLGINLPTGGAHNLHAAALPDENLLHTIGTNTPTGGAHVLAVKPPDESLVMARGTNTPTAGAHTLSVKPPDESLVMTIGTNTPTGGGHTISVAEEEDDLHYDLGISAPQIAAYTASQVIGAHRFSCAVTIPANFGAHLGRSSRAGGSAVATASTVFNVDKAAAATPTSFSNVGTITFAAGTVTPTFASSGGTAISFAADDVIRIVAPPSPDATFAGLMATIVGYPT